MGNSISSSCSNCKRKPEKGKLSEDHVIVCNNINGLSTVSNTIPNGTSEPFYLHPPLNERPLETPHAPENGLYINPMNKHRHSISNSSDSGSSAGSVNGESFFLHNPQEVIYNRVKDLFEAPSPRPPLSALTVKVEVHSSSSGAGSDENLSSSDLSERSGDHEHDYEDIYLVRENSANKMDQNNNRSRSRDSGSHSRSGSVSSSNSCNVTVKLNSEDVNANNNVNSQTTDVLNEQNIQQQNEQSQRRESVPSAPHSRRSSAENTEKVKLDLRHSSPPKNSTDQDDSTNNEDNISNSSNNSRILKRATSSPPEISPPPPPPPPPSAKSLLTLEGDDEPRGAEHVEVVVEPTLKPSAIVKGMCKSMSSLSARRLNSSCSDLTIVSLDGEDSEKHAGPNLVNKQRALPFVPPSFPGTGDSNNLIKPSEYLRSISGTRSSVSPSRSVTDSEDSGSKLDSNKENTHLSPPPPPLPSNIPEPPSSPSTESSGGESVKKQSQPLSSISIQDLNSVQLRRTDKMIASKTFSAPTRSVSLQCLQSDSLIVQKTNLIAELKMSRDITGIKKMKVERAKKEESLEKEILSEISKQFTTTKFVEKVPEKDNTGNIIPPWKRQMLAKKAAEKAKKELEEQLLREAEEKRLQSIPQWKRQLLQKKEESENKIRSTLYTPKVVDENRVNKLHTANDSSKHPTSKEENREENNNTDESIKFEQLNDNEQSDEELPNIIPWRAQLRKTNSKLNLLD